MPGLGRPKTLMKIDYDRLALEYSQHRRVHPNVLEELIRLSALRKDSKVLEV